MLTRSLLLKGSITGMGQHESGRRLWFRAQLKPRAGWGVYGSSREAISSYVKANESAATASWRRCGLVAPTMGEAMAGLLSS